MRAQAGLFETSTGLLRRVSAAFKQQVTLVIDLSFSLPFLGLPLPFLDPSLPFLGLPLLFLDLSTAFPRPPTAFP